MKNRITFITTIIGLFTASAIFAGPPPGGWAANNNALQGSERVASHQGCGSCEGKEDTDQHDHSSAMADCHVVVETCPGCESESKLTRKGPPSRSGGNAFVRIQVPSGECNDPELRCA